MLGSILRNPALIGLGCVLGIWMLKAPCLPPWARDSHTRVIRAKNCHLVHFSDFRWVCASLGGTHTN